MIWNFLPPEELNAILSLYGKVTGKTMMISKTMGIEERKLMTPGDDYGPLKEFNQSYEGTKSFVEEMHLEYQSLILENRELEDQLNNFSGAVFSGCIRQRGHETYSSATPSPLLTGMQANLRRKQELPAGISIKLTMKRSFKNLPKLLEASDLNRARPVAAP